MGQQKLRKVITQPGLEPRSVGPQSPPDEAEISPAPDRGPYLRLEHLVQRGAAAHQPVHQRQPQAQRAVIDGLHEDDLRQDQQWVPHVATELARHAGPRDPATARAWISAAAPWAAARPGTCEDTRRASAAGPEPWQRRPVWEEGLGPKGRAHYRSWGEGGTDRPIRRVRGNLARSSCLGPALLKLLWGPLTRDRLAVQRVRARPSLIDRTPKQS